MNLKRKSGISGRNWGPIFTAGMVALFLCLAGCHASGRNLTADSGKDESSASEGDGINPVSEGKVRSRGDEIRQAVAEQSDDENLTGEDDLIAPQPSRWARLWGKFGNAPRIPLPRTDAEPSVNSSVVAPSEDGALNDF